MLSNTFFGCAIFLITNGCLLYSAHLLVRRFLSPVPHAARLVALGVMYYSFIILIFQGLSAFEAISKTWVTISCLLLALLFHLLWGEERNFKADIEPITLWLRDALASRWSVLIIFCGFVVLLSFSRALLMPPLVYDCLTYHLTFAALWIKKGALVFFNAPDQITDCAFFPINGELFAAWFLLPFHTDLLVNTINFPITLLAAVACYGIARELGLTRKEASFAPALICFAPMIYSQITTALVDNASFAFYAASVLFILRYLREGYLHDGFLALVAGGILLGIKHSGIPVVGLIFIAFTVKLIHPIRFSGFFRRCSVILLGLFLLCALGGRQYILNTINVHNPLYPFSVEVLGHKLLEGSDKWEQVSEWVSHYEKERGQDTFSLWEREYRKFLYMPITIGPKFLVFLLLAVISLYTRPHTVSKRQWYFLALLWIIPIALYNADTAANVARKGPWIESSSRFLSPYIALFTIMGLVAIKRFSDYFKGFNFFFVALITWDLLYINKNHLWEVEIAYPLIVLVISLVLLSWRLVRERLREVFVKEKVFTPSGILAQWGVLLYKRWIVYTMWFFALVAGLYSLQCYRDTTRYNYYSHHSDHQGFTQLSRNLVHAWEFLDQPDGKKTIAMGMNGLTPLGRWLYYPLLGRWLQNDIVYISAKHKWEVPGWLDRGLLRGTNFSTWLFNLKKENVDYIFVMHPWPLEFEWLQRYQDKFQLVFYDNYCRIYTFTGKGDL